MNNTSRNFIVSLWAVGGLVAAGFLLQLLLGPFEGRLLAAPVNLYIGGAIVLLCVATAMWADSRFVRWFTGLPMAVCVIGALCVLALIMGLTPQGAVPTGSVAEVSARLGFNAMISSWAFVIVWFVLLVSLGGLIARRIAAFRLRDWGFYLNHVGLWLVLFAAGLGHPDIERYEVRVDEGASTRQGYDRTGHPRVLPLTVRLHDFVMEQYPPLSTDARPEPKRFASDIEITTADGYSKRGLTEVNHPFRIGSWRVYQSGYDRAAGPESRYSVLELVRDPWLVPVYVGFAMIAIGALTMIWKGRRRK